MWIHKNKKRKQKTLGELLQIKDYRDITIKWNSLNTYKGHYRKIWGSECEYINIQFIILGYVSYCPYFSKYIIKYFREKEHDLCKS